jgi:DNA-binding transcriptional ArsR family regulator
MVVSVDSEDGMKAVNSIVKASRGIWLLSHVTTREKLDSMMEDGIVPEYREFRGVADRMTLAADAKDGDFRSVRRRLEQAVRRDSAYVIFERPEGVEHVYEFLARRNPEELKRIVAQGAVNALRDWFVTTKVVGPESIAIIYRFDGQVMYVREALSQ